MVDNSIMNDQDKSGASSRSRSANRSPVKPINSKFKNPFSKSDLNNETSNQLNTEVPKFNSAGGFNLNIKRENEPKFEIVSINNIVAWSESKSKLYRALAIKGKKI